LWKSHKKTYQNLQDFDLQESLEDLYEQFKYNKDKDTMEPRSEISNEGKIEKTQLSEIPEEKE